MLHCTVLHAVQARQGASLGQGEQGPGGRGHCRPEPSLTVLCTGAGSSAGRSPVAPGLLERSGAERGLASGTTKEVLGFLIDFLDVN